MKLLSKRISIFFIITIILLSVSLLKVGYMQFGMGEAYIDRAFDLWTRQIPVSSKRGNIYDRNGKLLAGSILSPTVYIIPTQIKDKDYTINTLETILEIKDTTTFRKQFEKKVSVTNLGKESINISLDKAKKIIAKGLDGVYISSDTIRYYPYGDKVLSNVLGIVGKDNIGLSGIEYMYDSCLRGMKSSANIFCDSHGNEIKTRTGYYVEGSCSVDIYLTIDIDIQLALESILDNIVLTYSPLDAISIISNPNTSEIYAMSQRPNYEISKYNEYDSDIYNRNLCIWKNYEPGSTFKIATFASGLDQNIFSLDEAFYCHGYTMIDKTMVRDWKKGGHGALDFCGVLQNSCNPGLMEIGRRIGKDTLFDYYHNFGFGQKTNIDLLGESKGIIMPLDKVGPLELATCSFGQGNAVTAIQIVNCCNSIINGGTLNQPYLLKAISINNNIFETPLVKPIRRVIKKDTSEKMKYALETVCSYGTARSSYIEGYRVGGKTGTSQVVENGVYSSDRFILSFLGCLPMNDPKVVCYMAIDKPQSYIQYGGVIVAPLVKKLLESSITSLDIKKQPGQIPLISRYWQDKRIFKVNDYIGLNIDQIRLDPNYQIEIKGNGTKVLDQSPKPNETILEGSKVYLYT